MVVNITYVKNTPNTAISTVNNTSIVNISNVERVMRINVAQMGSPGLSAYQLAISNGFVGTESEWLASLKQYNYIARHGYTNTMGIDVSYCGIAVEGSLETDNVWKITRITIDVNGTTTTATANNVDWVNYLTHTYV